MNDVIYRQAAIEVADAVWMVTGDKNVAKVWDQLKDVPSAQKKGHWIYKETVYEADECSCSECGQTVTTHKGERMNFCPNCGADMRGEEDG